MQLHHMIKKESPKLGSDDDGNACLHLDQIPVEFSSVYLAAQTFLRRKSTTGLYFICGQKRLAGHMNATGLLE